MNVVSLAVSLVAHHAVSQAAYIGGQRLTSAWNRKIGESR